MGKKGKNKDQAEALIVSAQNIQSEDADSSEEEILVECPPILDPAGDEEMIVGFNEQKAKKQIWEFENITKMVLSLELQKDMGLEIGVNLSAEHPWQQIDRNVILEYLPDDTPQQTKFKQKIQLNPSYTKILVGYSAAESEEEDTFHFCENDLVAKQIAYIVQKLEAFQRIKSRKALVKKSQRWTSLGSEKEIELQNAKTVSQKIDVEIQSVYPIKHPQRMFQLRLTSDVRDGYVQLLPKPNEPRNLMRKRVSIDIQSAPHRLNLEQQTDPTFPANAWSQYLYEIQGKDDDAIEEAKEEDMRAKEKVKLAKMGIIFQEEPLPMSDKFTELLNTLEFNEVNMYRNDYPFIAAEKIPKYSHPHLTEVFCFADISKNMGRIASSIDWHPVYSGISVVSYTYTSRCTAQKSYEKIDKVQRTVMSSNPVLMWSFDNTLSPKLQFESHREVTFLTMCPYDENLVIGGTQNGQLILWYIKDRLKKIETEEILTADQVRHRTLMRSFLDWTREYNHEIIIRPAAISNMESSHKGPITNIMWIDRSHYIAATGHIYKHPNVNNFRIFISSSMDGSIAFWDLDYNTVETRKETSKKQKLPDFMITEENEYSRLNTVFKPMYMLVYNEPISDMVIDEATYKYIPVNVPPDRKIDTRVSHICKQMPMEQYQNQIIITTFLGNISYVRWEGSEVVPALDVKKEHINQSEKLASIHDGPIMKISRNKFLPELFITIGRNILALWTDNLPWAPIFWRRRPVKLTDCRWSNRPSVFFITRDDGTIEAWDFLSRVDEPILINSLGGSVLTHLTQHKLSFPMESICVGDYNSCVRVLLVPPLLTRKMPNEVEHVKEFIAREEKRKHHIRDWQKAYYMSNADLREAKKRAAEEAQRVLEKLEKEFREKEELRLKKEEDDRIKALIREKQKAGFDLPQRLQQKYDEMNLKRLMKVLMSMKMVDPQLLAKWTKPEKDRIAYTEKKRKAIAECFKNIMDEYEVLKARLLPSEEPDEARNDFVYESVKFLLQEEHTSDGLSEYEDIQNEILDYVHKHNTRTELSYPEILRRARQRRDVVNKSLGSNTEHRHAYTQKKTEYVMSRVKLAAPRLTDESFVSDNFSEDISEIQSSVAESSKEL